MFIVNDKSAKAKSKLSSEVKKLMTGPGHIRIAVAYIGEGADLYFDVNRRITLICDFYSSGTNPSAVKSIIEKFEKHGKMKNLTILDCPNLHAKVYLNDESAIIGSSNLSTNGVDMQGEGSAKNIEAGFSLNRGEMPVVYDDLSKWMDELCKNKTVISKKTVDFEAEIRRYRLLNRANPKKQNVPSLEDFYARPDNYIVFFYDGSLSDVDDDDELADLDYSVGVYEKEIVKTNNFYQENLKKSDLSLLRDLIVNKYLLEVTFSIKSNRFILSKIEVGHIKDVQWVKNKKALIFFKTFKKKESEELIDFRNALQKNISTINEHFRKNAKKDLMAKLDYINGDKLLSLINFRN